MKANVEYGLRGSFKVDTYDSKNNLVESSDWFDNFITQSGLLYPTIYSFANCFRFLTIGDSNNNNQGGMTSNDTTGCYSPLYSFTVSDNSTQHGNWMGYEGYETGTNAMINSSCQTQVTSNGLRFFRAWSVPSGISNTFIKNGGSLNIQEFAVSPSSGGDPIGCFAFSRVKRNLPIKDGYRAVISYQLQVNCSNYALTPFNAGTFITGNADVTTDLDMISEWANLSGFYKQTWAGLSCIDAYGVTFIPKYGNGMEPSLTDLNDYSIYFSPDNAAFEVSKTGGRQTDVALAWASDGVMSPLTQNLTLKKVRTAFPSTTAGRNVLYYGAEANGVEGNDVPTEITPFNIRLGSISSPLDTANLRNYSVAIGDEYSDAPNSTFSYQKESFVDAGVETIAYASPGASGIHLERAPDYKQKAIFSTRIYRMPVDYTISGNYPRTGRRKIVSRKAVFSPAQSLGYNTRFGSMVFGYAADTDTVGNFRYYPLMDTLFYDTSGSALMSHYRLISGIYLTQRGTGVAGCSITLRHVINGGNEVPSSVSRLNSRRTFSGPLTGYVQVPPYVTDPAYNNRYGNLFSGWNGTGVVGVGGTSGNLYFYSPLYGGCTGWGAVYGVTGDDYNNGSLPYDVGLARHWTGSLIQPTGLTGNAQNLSQLYWPYVYQGGAIYVDFHNITFLKQSDSTLWPDNPSFTPTQLAASGFCRPTGYIVHYDAIGGVGNRLLPNHAQGNTTNIDYYSPSVGGALPGFSLDNGMEVYLDVSWSSDCAGAQAGTCIEP